MNRLFATLLLVSMSSAPALAADGNWNFRFNPLTVLIGGLDLALDYKVNENITVGPTLTYINLKSSNIDVKGSGFGVKANYFFDGVFRDGFYADAGVGTTSLDANAKYSSGDSLSANSNGTVITVGGGYAWFWESFNINLGLQLGRTSVTKIEIKDSNGVVKDSYSPGGGGGIDFKFGFVF